MSGELFKEGVKKLWVLPLILTIILVLIVPVYTLLEKSAIEESLVIFEQIDESASNANESIKTNLTGAYKEMAGATFIFTPYVMLTVLILPVVLGVQLFGNSKKKKNRLADFVEKKGLDKKCVYKTNIVTGIFLSIMPILVTTILLIIIKLFAGMGDYITGRLLVCWSLLPIICSILFFTVTILVGFITKSKPLQVLYTYGVLFIPVFLVYLFEVVLTRIIYGFPGFSVGIVEFLNQVPSIKICQIFSGASAEYIVSHSLDIWYTLIYIIISGICVLGGYKLLNVKNQENLQTLGDKIFKYVWIFVISAFLYVAFSINFNNALKAILLTVFVLLVVYVIKVLITKKSFKALAGGKIYYIISAVSIILVAILSNNIFNYETKLPEMNDVEYMTYTSSYPNGNGEIKFKTEENIKYLMEKHQKFIDEKNVIKEIENIEYTKVYLKYKLKNGKSIIRSYETTLSVDEPIFVTEEYIQQKYAYMYDNSENVDILKIAGYYNNKQFMFEVNRYEDKEMLEEIINSIATDLLENKVHVETSGEYLQYSEKEGIQILQIALLDGMNQYTSYLYYLKIDEEYKLVEKLQELIDDESEFIAWSE